MEGVRRVGLLLVAFGVLLAALTFVLNDPWLLVVGVVPAAVGVVIAAGLIGPSRLVDVVAVGALVAGLALVALGVAGLLMSTYGPLVAAFVVPPGAALVAIAAALLGLKWAASARRTVADGDVAA
jgi:hypothetical protein